MKLRTSWTISSLSINFKFVNFNFKFVISSLSINGQAFRDASEIQNILADNF